MWFRPGPRLEHLNVETQRSMTIDNSDKCLSITKHKLLFSHRSVGSVWRFLTTRCISRIRLLLHLPQHRKNGHSQTEEGANLQAVGANLSEHVAQTLVNPDKSEGKNKIVQWDYFLYWPRSSSGKKSLYEKRVF